MSAETDTTEARVVFRSKYKQYLQEIVVVSTRVDAVVGSGEVDRMVTSKLSHYRGIKDHLLPAFYRIGAEGGYNPVEQADLDESLRAKFTNLGRDSVLVSLTFDEPIVRHFIPEDDPGMYAFLRQNR